MKQILNYMLMALAISFVIIACNNEAKKAEPAATNTDTTQTQPAKTDNSQMVDAVKAAPDLYKVLKDTMGIRVLEAIYKPGDSSAMHSHPDYVVYAAEGGKAIFYAKDGSKMENTMPQGAIMIRGAEEHSVKNSGKSTIRVILVEVNRPMKASSWDASMDATKLAPKLYKLVKDTLGLRAIEVNYKPGESSAMHSHPDVALYVVQGSTAEFTSKDGTKRTVELKTGMVLIAPADTHSVKNTGKTTMKGILVEVNRAAN